VGTVNMFNRGNGVDTFSITLENAVEMQAAGIVTTLPLRVTSNRAQTNVSFTIQATNGTNPRTTTSSLWSSPTRSLLGARRGDHHARGEAGGLISVNQNPTTVVIGVAGSQSSWGRRVAKGAEAPGGSQEARRQLQKIMKTRREQSGVEPTPVAVPALRPSHPRARKAVALKAAIHASLGTPREGGGLSCRLSCRRRERPPAHNREAASPGVAFLGLRRKLKENLPVGNGSLEVDPRVEREEERRDENRKELRLGPVVEGAQRHLDGGLSSW